MKLDHLLVFFAAAWIYAALVALIALFVSTPKSRGGARALSPPDPASPSAPTPQASAVDLARAQGARLANPSRAYASRRGARAPRLEDTTVAGPTRPGKDEPCCN